MDIWKLCRGHKKISSLSLEAWRVVEDQSTSLTRRLVGSSEEHEILELEIENSKPPLAPECVGFNYLLFTPSRYPPLKHGSRFGNSMEPSLWYGSCQLHTALAERAYYRFVFLLGSEIRDAMDRVSKTAFTAKINSPRGMDLTYGSFIEYKDSISSPTGWKISQQLGKNMREHGVEAFKYFSARSQDSMAMNIGVFSCNAFSARKPIYYKSLVEFSNRSSVEFYDKESQEKVIFKLEDFRIEGQFPFPPD